MSDPDVCVEFLAAMRCRMAWNAPPVRASSTRSSRTRHISKCKDCGRQFSVKLGTAFEDSLIPFDKW